MSRSKDDERTPLVYEHRIPSSSDAGRRRRRRHYICVALTTICLGIGLVLAVALPITMSQGKASTNPPVLLLAKLGLPSESASAQASSNWSNDQNADKPAANKIRLQPASFSSDLPSPSSSSSASSEHSSSNRSSDSNVSSTSSTDSPPDPFTSCNVEVPHERGSDINLDQLNGKLLFELYRVQTRNSPGYASGLSCSVMELDFGNSTNANLSKTGTMKLKWMESGFTSKYPRAVDVNLERSQSWSPYDWMETFPNQSDAKGRLSLLIQIGDYLLTFECFPSVSFYPSPAYAIHLYSMVPWTGNTYVATSLMTLANIWGLNPVEERLNPVSHRFCSLVNVPH